MSVTVPIQVRLDLNLVKAIDQRASSAKMSRSDVLLAGALAAPQPVPVATQADPLLDRIVDALGTVLAKVDAGLEASRSAHAAARLGALMLLPADRQGAFVDKLTKAAQP